jgi:hypothetical protein
MALVDFVLEFAQVALDPVELVGNRIKVSCRNSARSQGCARPEDCSQNK